VLTRGIEERVQRVGTQLREERVEMKGCRGEARSTFK